VAAENRHRPRAETNEVAHPVRNPSQTICILDDDASVLKAMRRLLRSAGLQALALNEARAFLQHAGSNGTALAIIDVWMPDINGLEVQRKLLEMVPSIPVIMMSGRDCAGDAQRRPGPRRDGVFGEALY
jgi:FixJ family two-component response regulator